MVKRYEFTGRTTQWKDGGEQANGIHLRQEPNGPLVLLEYSDYAALRKELEELRGERDIYREAALLWKRDVGILQDELSAKEQKLALYEKAVEPVRECWDNELARLSEYYWKKESDGPEQAIRDCIRTLSETK